MECDRAAKLRRLECLRRRLPHMSAAALAEACRVFSTEPVPDLHQRKHCAEAAELILESSSSLGPVLRKMTLVGCDGRKVTVDAVDFWPYLDVAVRAESGFAAHFWNTLDDRPVLPSRPWSLVVYADEIVPGNVLAPDPQRRLWAAYASFLELGSYCLQQEHGWLCVGLIRSSILSRVAAGMSQWIGEIIRNIFGQPVEGQQIPVALTRRGRVHLFAARLSMILQDGGAHKALWSCKGDAGTRFCLLCRNCIARRCKILDEAGCAMVGSTDIVDDNLVRHTDSTVLAAIDRLKEKRTSMNSADFELWQQASGWVYRPHSLLFQSDLRWVMRPVSQYCHDSMHTLLVSGVFQTTMWLFLTTLQSRWPLLWETLHEYLGAWHAPKHWSNAQDAFSPKRKAACRSAGAFKCTASEGLSLFPLLACFVRRLRAEDSDACVPATTALLRLEELMHVCQLARRKDAVQTADMRKAVAGFLESFVEAGRSDCMHSKFHWLLHFGDHLSKWRHLPQCFTHERKHRMIKRYADDIHNTRTFERGLLRQVLAHELHEHCNAHPLTPAVSLVQPRTAPKAVQQCVQTHIPELVGAPSVKTSLQARLATGDLCNRGDVVMAPWDNGVLCGEVWLLLEVNLQPAAVLLLLPVTKRCPDTHEVLCGPGADVLLVPCDLILCACYWRGAPSQSRRVLVPFHLREQV